MVIDNWRLLAAIDGGLLFMLSAMNLYRLFIGHRAAKADGAGSDDEQDPWRILYEDEDDEDEDLGNQPSTAYMNGDKNEYLQKMPESSAGPCFYQSGQHKGRKSGVYLPSMVRMRTL